MDRKCDERPKQRRPAQRHALPPAAGAIGRARAYRDRLLAEDSARVARAEAFVAALPERPRHLGVPELSEAPLDVASLRRLAASVREFASGAVSS